MNKIYSFSYENDRDKLESVSIRFEVTLKSDSERKKTKRSIAIAGCYNIRDRGVQAKTLGIKNFEGANSGYRSYY